MKRIITLVLCLALLTCTTGTSFASDELQEIYDIAEKEQKYDIPKVTNYDNVQTLIGEDIKNLVE